MNTTIEIIDVVSQSNAEISDLADTNIGELHNLNLLSPQYEVLNLSESKPRYDMHPPLNDEPTYPNVNVDTYADMLEFILSTKSEFIIQQDKEQTREIRYFLTKPEPTRNMYFVTLLDEKEPFDDPLYGGCLFVNDNSSFGFSKGKSGNYEKSDYEIGLLLSALTQLSRNVLSRNITMTYVAKCGNCGRRLTDSESIRRGYGKECYEKINKECKVWETL